MNRYYYKRPENRISHDETRKKHIELIERKLEQYAEKPNEKLGKEIGNLYEQLRYYDKEILNVYVFEN